MQKLALVATLLLFPGAVFAHQGEASAPWIDFSQFGFDTLSKMPNSHPVFVHFPIALLPLMLLFYGLGIWRKSPAWFGAGRITLWLAFASLLVVVYTGMAARSTPSNDAIEKIMGTHKHLGWVILGLSAVLTAWSFWTKDGAPRVSWAFLIVGVLAACLILQNADLGGRMVYLHGAAVKPMIEKFKTDEANHAHSD